MSNRTESRLSGIGSLRQVVACHIEPPDVGNEMRQAMNDLRISVANLMRMSDTTQAVNACACAILNEQFEKTGYLLTANESGRLNVTFVACDSDRKVILNLMAD